MTDEAPEDGAAAIPRGRLTLKRDGVGKLSARALALGALGFSRSEIAANVECSREELAKWAAAKPNLAKALARARDLELAWWERRGREGVESGKLNATLWSKAMAGRFPDEGYGERTTAAAARPVGARRRLMTPRDRAKAVRLLIAESGPPAATDPATSKDSQGEPR